MQIKLVESDIRAGIALYLNSRGITGVNAENLQVTFTNGRKGSGLSAEVVTNPQGNAGTPVAKASAAPQAKEKSSADLPNALGGTAGESSGVAGADAAAKQLEEKREQAEDKPEEVEVKEPVVEQAAEQKPSTEEGTSLFA